MSRCITITKPRILSFSSRVSFSIFGLAPIYLNRIPQQIACYASEASKEKTQLPQPTPKKGTVSVQVANLVEQIASLTLIETAELVQELKSRLNIQDVALPAMNVVAAAPVAEAPKVEEVKAPEKADFTVKLEKYEATAKTKIIREIKNILPGMNLVEAKKFVESAPKVIKEHVNKDEAEKIKKTLEGFGAIIILE